MCDPTSRPPPGSHLLWLISALPPLFLPGPQLWRRRGDSERMLLLKSEGRRGTSVSLSLASSASPPPTPPDPVVAEGPAWAPSTGLQLHSRPWLPSRLELDGQALAVSSVEEQETETSLVLSPPPVTASSCCGHPTRRLIYKHSNFGPQPQLPVIHRRRGVWRVSGHCRGALGHGARAHRPLCNHQRKPALFPLWG